MASAAKPPLRLPNVNIWLIYALGLTPALYNFYLGSTGGLGINPVKTFEHLLGLWALKFLIATLLVTPLRDLFNLNLLRYRRALGLLAFYYVAMHLAVYMLLDKQLDMAAVVADIIKRPYITFGMAAFAMLVPLALTSNNASIKQLGSRWSKLHKLIYLIAVAACLHYFLLVKSITSEPFIHIALIAMLLCWRIVRKPYLRWKNPRKR
jgi:sulfoxide reductase heme-binding subunit YedZ